ncbi:MAG: LysR substrate-binding domain-containing protein [Janthinobacterium lividum]
MLNTISLPAIRAFEAAARNGSFRRAADELGLSPSAISHAIANLEQSLGSMLFERNGRSIKLSADGEQLMRHVSNAFDELRWGVEAVTNRGPKLLRLHCAPSFAAQWLSPRLSGFLLAHRDISVRLAASTDYSAAGGDDFDVDIIYGRPRSDGRIVVPLGEEIVTPICAPLMADRVRTAADLLDLVLIQSDRKQVRWPDWFAANAIPSPRFQGSGMRFDRSFLAIAAAVDGLGVALESTRLAERELASGRVVAPLLQGGGNIRYVGHYLVYPAAAQHRATVRVFIDWLRTELGQPLDA